MTKKEFYFSSADEKTKIHAVEWLPENEPKAVLQISLGSASQVLQYEGLAEYFTWHGFVVVGNDLPDLELCDYGQEAMHACFKITKEKYPDIPYLLMGLFRGADTVHTFISSYPDAVEGAVLADAEQKYHSIKYNLPVLQVSGMEENCREAFRYIYRWTEERLDEMLYRAAQKQ